MAEWVADWQLIFYWGVVVRKRNNYIPGLLDVLSCEGTGKGVPWSLQHGDNLTVVHPLSEVLLVGYIHTDKKLRIGQNLGWFISRPRKNLEAMIVGAAMTCYNKHMKLESEKAGVILGFLGVSWVSRGTLLSLGRVSSFRWVQYCVSCGMSSFQMHCLFWL